MIKPLSNSQMLVTALLGAALWFAAAMLLRTIGPMGMYEGANRIILYVLVVPGTVPLVPLVGRLARLERAQLGLGLSFGTAVAVLLDGLALAWVPGLYGGAAYAAGAGAVILWGAGFAIMLGFWMARQRD